MKKDPGNVLAPYILKTVSTSVNGETVWYANKWKNLCLKIKRCFIKSKLKYPTNLKDIKISKEKFNPINLIK